MLFNEPKGQEFIFWMVAARILSLTLVLVLHSCAVTVSSTGAENQFQGDDNGHVGVRLFSESLVFPVPNDKTLVFLFFKKDCLTGVKGPPGLRGPPGKTDTEQTDHELVPGPLWLPRGSEVCAAPAPRCRCQPHLLALTQPRCRCQLRKEPRQVFPLVRRLSAVPVRPTWIYTGRAIHVCRAV